MTGFYNDAKWHRVRNRVRKRWRIDNRPCGYCGEPIDWSARPIVDHIINRKERPDLAYDDNNLQVVHHACNTRKGHWVENNDKQRIGIDGFPIVDSDAPEPSSDG